MSHSNPPHAQDHPREMISAHIDGELTLDEKRAVEGHLEHCGECRTLVADLRAITSGIAKEDVPPVPAAIASRIAWRIRSRGAAGETRGGWRIRFATWSPFAAGGLAAAALLAFLLLREGIPPDSSVVPRPLIEETAKGPANPPSTGQDKGGAGGYARVEGSEEAQREQLGDRLSRDQAAGGPTVIDEPREGRLAGAESDEKKQASGGTARSVSGASRARPEAQPDAPVDATRGIAGPTLSKKLEPPTETNRRAPKPAQDGESFAPEPESSLAARTNETKERAAQATKVGRADDSRTRQGAPASEAPRTPPDAGMDAFADKDAIGAASAERAENSLDMKRKPKEPPAAAAPPGGKRDAEAPAGPEESARLTQAACRAVWSPLREPLVLETKDPPRTVLALRRLVARLGGTLDETTGARPAWRIEVPHERYAELVSALRGLGAEGTKAPDTLRSDEDCAELRLRLVPR